jgi:predicted RNA polymerase sigma factor
MAKKKTKKKAAPGKRRPASKDLASELRRLTKVFDKVAEAPKDEAMALRSMVRDFADSLDAAFDALGDVIDQQDQEVDRQSWEHDRLLIGCLRRGFDEAALAMESGDDGTKVLARSVAAMSRFLLNVAAVAKLKGARQEVR